MGKKVYSPFLATFATSLLWVTLAWAQQAAGTVNGRATDEQHHALQGARVELQPLGLKTVSDGQGQFTLPGVPPGTYTVIVTYIGLAQFSRPVSVVAGEVTPVDASLSIQRVSEEVVVHGERQEGEVAALNRQRAADTIVSILPAEVITSLPNTNIADAVGRLPGVALERDEGEGKYVQIRGTEPRLTNVTINGVHVSSAEPDVRIVKLDVIPAVLVESVEVSKTLSASQDGDAIGGSVNLVTRSADDKPFYRLTLGAGYSPYVNGRWVVPVDTTVSKRFGPDHKLGLALSGAYDYNGRGYHNIEPTSPGTNDFGDGQGPVPVVTGNHLREYAHRRQRFGLSGSLDYRLSNGSSAYIRGLYAVLHDFGDTWNINESVGDLLTPTTSDANGNVVIRHLNRTPQQMIFSVAAGQKLNLGNYLVDYQFAVSRESSEGGFPSAYFNGPKNVAFGIDTTDPLTPKFPVLNGVDINNPGLYKFNRILGADDPARETDLEGTARLARHYAFGSHFGSLEVGAKFRSSDKTVSKYEAIYRATGDPALPYTAVLGSLTDPGFYFGHYTLPPLSDYAKILAWVAANPAGTYLDVSGTHLRSDPGNYNVTERIYAAYAMNTLNFNRVRVQFGARFEGTQSDFVGRHVATNADGDWVATTPVPGSSSYVDVLPSVQLQYTFAHETDLRLGYGMGIARPNFSDLPPYIVEATSDGQVSVGNPALKPTHAQNFDLLLERYLRPVGLVQGGVFYKDVRDPIYTVETDVASGQYAGYQQFQPVNGTKAHVFGVELAYQQHLTFLPGLLSGAGVSANYSHTMSKAVVPGRTDDPALIRQGPNNWNVSLTYDRGPLSLRYAVTHNDAYIYVYNYQPGADLGPRGPNGDDYSYAHTQMDVQGSCRVRGGLTLVGSVLNLNNEVFGFFFGSPQYPHQREYYGRTFTLALILSNSGK
jgi:TonB-dependent receptor